MSIKTFVISLPEATIRRAQVQKQLQTAKLDFTFFDAIDGRNFDVRQQPSYNSRKRRLYFGRDMSGGELGCMLSHRAIYEKMLAENIDMALVLEDDAVIHEDLSDVIESLKSCPVPFDLVRFLSSPKVAKLKQRVVVPLTGQYTLNRLCTTPGGAHGYIITNAGAQKLLKHTQHYHLPIDTLMGHCWTTGLNAFIVQPGLVWQDLEQENYIGETRFDKSVQLTGFDRLIFPLTRAKHKMTESVMKRMTYARLAAQDRSTNA